MMPPEAPTTPSSLAFRPKVTVVVGPPAAGKSTYIREHMQPGDLWLNHETLFSALSGMPSQEQPEVLRPYVDATLSSVVAQLSRPGKLRAAWIEAHAPSMQARFKLCLGLKARVVVIEATPGQCYERACAYDPSVRSPEDYRELAEGWWKRYERNATDEHISIGAAA